MLSELNEKRNPQRFDAAIIACTHDSAHNFCKSGLHPRELFYSIDFQSNKNPDLALNITEPLPSELNNKFHFTLVENLDYYAYNVRNGNNSGNDGFRNILNMTSDNGFIVFIGCPRQKEYRTSLHKNNLKYIELNANKDCLLIPKNQNLSIIELKKQLCDLPDAYKSSLTKIAGNLENLPEFCTDNIDNLETISQTVQREAREANQKKLTEQSPINCNNTLPTSNDDLDKNHNHHAFAAPYQQLGIENDNSISSSSNIIPTQSSLPRVPNLSITTTSNTFFMQNTYNQAKPTNRFDKPYELLAAGGVITALNVSALAIIFIALDIATLGIGGLVIAGLCAACALIGLVCMAIGAYRAWHSSESLAENSLISPTI